MNRWIVLMVAAVLIVVFVVAYAVWEHQMYTVGMDINVKAIFVAGVGLLAIATLAVAARFFLRRTRRD